VDITPNEAEVITDEGVYISPQKLNNPTFSLNLESPKDCERTCTFQQCLGTVDEEDGDDENDEQDLNTCLNLQENNEIEDCSNKTMRDCIKKSVEACSRDKGLCRPLKIPHDPYTLASFTVPAGYKKAQITIEHCTDRNDVLVVEGPILSFQTLNSGDLWNARFGANVGRGPRCQKEGLLDVAKIKIRTTDLKNNLGSPKKYEWKMPAALSFPINTKMITDMDISEPVFVHLKGMLGPGAKLHKIYDNYHTKGQLSFLMEYIFWYDPKYVTTFDFYYKKL